jgi:Cu/Ag efflux protein CusF
MLRRLMPFALTMTLFCPFAVFAQTPTDLTPPVAPAVPGAPAATPAPKKHNRAGGRISAVDAAAKTITLSRGKKTVVVSVPNTTKIFKVGDAKGQPTGTFTDLTIDTRVNVMTDGNETAPTAKTIHIRAPKTTAEAPAAPAVP